MSRRSAIRIHWLERAVISSGLLLSFAPVLSSMHSLGPGESPSQQPVFQAVWIAIYGFTLLISLRRRVAIARTVRANLVLVAPVALALASVFWSDAASVTVRHGVALLLTTLFALAIAELMPLDELFEMTAWAVACLLCISLVTSVWVPSYGVDHLRGGAWQGVFATKNELGRVAAFGLGLWLLKLGFTRHRVWVGSLAVLALFLLVESHSRTSFVAGAVIVVFVALVPMLRASPFVATAGAMFGTAAFAIAAMWAVAHQEVILSTLNSTPTLSGRSAIWSAAWTLIHRHVWLGYGYGAFWLGARGPSIALWNMVGSTPPHAHNGILDVWLDLGVVAVVLVVIAAFVLLRRAWALLRSPGPAVNAWPMLFFVFLAMTNLTESALLVQNTIYWILFVSLSSAALHRARFASQVVGPIADRRGLDPEPAQVGDARVRLRPGYGALDGKMS